MYITFKDFEDLTKRIKAENEKRLMAAHDEMSEENIIAFNKLNYAIAKAYEILKEFDSKEGESL